ncbi:MAG: oligosaccharide flippase family protein, partial [bacterium]
MHEQKRRVSRSLHFSAGSALGLTLFQIAQVAILARLLGPEAFGLMAIILVAATLGGIVGQMGLVEAIVSRKHVSAREFSSLYWFNIVWGVIVYAGLAAAAPAIAWSFGQPDLARMLPVALLSVAIAPFGALFLASAQKHLKFGRIAAVEIAAAAAGLAVAVVSAWAWNQGAWSL